MGRDDRPLERLLNIAPQGMDPGSVTNMQHHCTGSGALNAHVKCFGLQFMHT